MSEQIIDPWAQYHGTEGERYKLIYVSGDTFAFDKQIINHVLEAYGATEVLHSEKKAPGNYPEGRTFVAEIKVGEAGNLSRHLTENVAGLGENGNKWAVLQEVRSLGKASGTDLISDFFSGTSEDLAKWWTTGTKTAEGTAEEISEKAGEAAEEVSTGFDAFKIALPIVLAGVIAYSIIQASE